MLDYFSSPNDRLSVGLPNGQRPHAFFHLRGLTTTHGFAEME
jgi:hypothetical protein